MKNVTKHVGRLERVKRMPSSKNGNPRFKLLIISQDKDIEGNPIEGSPYARMRWICRTQVNAMLGYVVENHVGKMVEVHIGDHYGKKTVNCLYPWG